MHNTESISHTTPIHVAIEWLCSVDLALANSRRIENNRCTRLRPKYIDNTLRLCTYLPLTRERPFSVAAFSVLDGLGFVVGKSRQQCRTAVGHVQVDERQDQEH